MFGAGALMLALVQVGFHLGPMSLLKCQPLKGILFIALISLFALPYLALLAVVFLVGLTVIGCRTGLKGHAASFIRRACARAATGLLPVSDDWAALPQRHTHEDIKPAHHCRRVMKIPPTINMMLTTASAVIVPPNMRVDRTKSPIGVSVSTCPAVAAGMIVKTLPQRK
jgi:hypothetical protein